MIFCINRHTSPASGGYTSSTYSEGDAERYKEDTSLCSLAKSFDIILTEASTAPTLVSMNFIWIKDLTAPTQQIRAMAKMLIDSINNYAGLETVALIGVPMRQFDKNEHDALYTMISEIMSSFRPCLVTDDNKDKVQEVSRRSLYSLFTNQKSHDQSNLSLSIGPIHMELKIECGKDPATRKTFKLSYDRQL